MSSERAQCATRPAQRRRPLSLSPSNSEYLHLPAEVVPATLHRKERVAPAGGRPAGDRPPRAGAGRGFGGDRSEYRRGR